MEILYENLLQMDWRYLVMWAIGGILIYLAIKKDMEPTLLLPIGFGTILVNLPNSGAITQIHNGVAEPGALSVLFDAGISNELFPLILFIGIGAMIDFGPLLSNPKLMIFGAAAQFEEDLLAGVKYDMILFGTKYDGFSALQDKDLFMDISVAAENADLLPCLRGTASNTALPFSMSVSTLVAADTTVSSAAEFTWETLFALYEGLGDGETLFSTDVSEQLTVTMLSDYIDMDAAACTLDSPDFARAVEFISDVRKTKNSRVANPLCDGNLGSLAMGATSCFGDPVGSLQSGALKFLTVNLDMLDSLISVPYLFEEAGLNPVFCGYPTKQGGTLYATPRVNMTIPKTAANKAGTYAFLQYALSDAVQCSDRMAARAMPVTRAAYETQIQSGYFYIRVFAEELTNWMLEEVTDAPREQHTGLAEVHVTEEERAAMVSYFADTTARVIYDSTVRATIDEELSAAASGVRSTEDASASMASKPTL